MTGVDLVEQAALQAQPHAEVYAARPGQSTLRLIVSADVINDNDDVPVVLAVHVVDADPDSLLACRVGGAPLGAALSIEPVMRRRLVERVGAADQEMDAVARRSAGLFCGAAAGRGSDSRCGRRGVTSGRRPGTPSSA